MLTVIEKVIFLQNVDVFTDVPTEELAYLAAIADEVEYKEGNDIYRQDDPSDALYVVLGGKVRLYQGDKDVKVAEAKDAFGTWALLDEAPRLMTATPLEDAQLLRVDREDFFDLLADHTQITQGVFKTVVKRQRKLTEVVSKVSAMKS